jgi:hypothetical protein
MCEFGCLKEWGRERTGAISPVNPTMCIPGNTVSGRWF